MNSTSVGVVTLALLLATGLAQAGDDSDITQQNLSKRPYHTAPTEKEADSADQWDGATLVKENEADNKAAPTPYQKLRIHMFGQRPYMEGNQ